MPTDDPIASALEQLQVIAKSMKQLRQAVALVELQLQSLTDYLIQQQQQLRGQ